MKATVTFYPKDKPVQTVKIKCQHLGDLLDSLMGSECNFWVQEIRNEN